MVSYVVRCERFSAWMCSTRTVIFPGGVLPMSSCIAPDVIAAAWCPMCDGQATQILLINCVAFICTPVEAYWYMKRVPHCSATDVVVLHPMHWKDNRVTTSLDYWSTDLGALAQYCASGGGQVKQGSLVLMWATLMSPLCPQRSSSSSQKNW